MKCSKCGETINPGEVISTVRNIEMFMYVKNVAIECNEHALMTKIL